jgi:hypothetical protein
MPFYKKLLILLIIIIFTYVLYRLYKKRLEIVNREGYFFDKTVEQEIIDAKDDDNPVKINSVNDAYSDIPVLQCLIKGSYNTAITKNFVSLDMIQYVLSRGCRFIDFEVFYLDEKPMVSYSNDPNFAIIETDNRILLDNVLSHAVTNGFNSPAPNKNDPLFIQLRIKSNEEKIYNEVAKSINNTLINRLYKGEITKTTKISDIKGKVVLVVDRTINYKYKDFTNCNNPNDKTCYDLKKQTNIESGSEFLRTTDSGTILSKRIKPPVINNNNLTTDVDYLQIVTFDSNKNDSNKNPIPLIKDYGCQIMLYQFYNKNENLQLYEHIFNDNLYGIVPLSVVLIYLKTDPRGIMNTITDAEDKYNSIIGIKMNNNNNGGVSKLLDSNTTAIIVGSIFGGIAVFLAIGIMASRKQPQKSGK